MNRKTLIAIAVTLGLAFGGVVLAEVMQGWESVSGTPVNVKVDGTGQVYTVGGGTVAGDVAHDAVDSGNPVKVGGRARTSQIGAVANNDRTDAVFNAYGELVLAGYTWATSSIRTEEIDPISEKHDPATLCALTNIATNTTDYCGYIDMDGYRSVGIQIETSGAAPVDVLTVTLEATIQDDGTAQAACTYQDVTLALAGVASWVDTDAMFLHDTTLPVKYLRVAYVTSNGGGNDADLTVYVKKLY